MKALKFPSLRKPGPTGLPQKRVRTGSLLASDDKKGKNAEPDYVEEITDATGKHLESANHFRRRSGAVAPEPD